MSEAEGMTVDCSNNPSVFSPVEFDDQAVECGQQYKYLGTVTASKLTFEHHIDAVCICQFGDF